MFRLVGLPQLEPVEAIRRQRDHIRQFADRRKAGTPEHLQRDAILPRRKIEFGRLCRARQIGHAEDHLVAILADIGEHATVDRTNEGHGAAAKRQRRLPYRDQPLGRAQQRRQAARLRLDIDRLVAIDRIHDGRRVQPGRIGAGETAIAVRRPLHRRANAVAVAEIDVVAHADFIAIVDDRRAGERQQQRVHQLDLAAVVVHQRRETAANPDIDARAGVVGVGRPQIVAFDIGHHFERQLVMVAQKQSPLAGARNVRRLAQDVGDRKPVLLRDRHVDPRHQRKMICHVAFVAAAEIFLDVFRPLIGLREQRLALGVGIEFGAQPLDDGVRLRQVLVVGAVAFAQIGNGIEPEAVNAGVEPSFHHLDQRADDPRVVEIEIGLVREEAVPVELAGFRVPRPVRFLGVGEDDPRAQIFLVGIAPHIPVARARFRIAAAGALEPVVLVGGMVDHQFGDDPQTAALRLDDEAPEILHRAEIAIDVAIVGDVVAVVAAGRGIERQ